MINDEERLIRNKKRIAIGLAIVFLVACIAIFAYYLLNRHNEMVVITNLNTCVTDMSSADQDEIFRSIYPYIKEQNAVNLIPTQASYEGIVRAGTCQTQDYDIDGQKSHYTEFILDIPTLQQSYRISFNWVKTYEEKLPETDLGHAGVSCLEPEELIYDDFNCDQNSLITTINANGDPILEVLPYFGDGYSLSPTLSTESSSGYSIILTYDPPSEVYLGGTLAEFQAERYKMMENYLKSKNIDISNYTIIEKYVVE